MPGQPAADRRLPGEPRGEGLRVGTAGNAGKSPTRDKVCHWGDRAWGPGGGLDQQHDGLPQPCNPVAPNLGNTHGTKSNIQIPPKLLPSLKAPWGRNGSEHCPQPAGGRGDALRWLEWPWCGYRGRLLPLLLNLGLLGAARSPPDAFLVREV